MFGNMKLHFLVNLMRKCCSISLGGKTALINVALCVFIYFNEGSFVLSKKRHVSTESEAIMVRHMRTDSIMKIHYVHFGRSLKTKAWQRLRTAQI